MRLAIPTWNDRVSPVFDTASRLVLVEVEQGAEQGRRIVQVGADPYPTQRVRRLGELHIDVLICGAISRPLAELMSASGVLVVPWVSGPVDDILRAYLTERLADPCWRMPGCQSHRIESRMR